MQQYVAIVKAKFQQQIIKKARAFLIPEAIEENLRKGIVRFDPQGHALVQIQLEDSDLEIIGENAKANITESEAHVDILQAQFETAKNGLDIPTLIGIDKTQPIFVNLDLQSSEWDSFKGWLTTNNNTSESKKIKLAFNLLKQSAYRSSIIPLQEEMEMHMQLTARVLASYLPNTCVVSWELVYQRASKLINDSIKQVFQNALLAALQENTLDIAKLNRFLDKKRKELAFQSIAALLKEWKSNTENLKTIYKDHIQHKLNNHDFEKFIATEENYLKTNSLFGIAVLISGTKYTSHHKEKDELALRILQRNYYTLDINKNDNVSPLPNTHVEARVPSIAVNKLAHQDSVDDIVKKLEKSYQTLQTCAGEYSKPIVYNLLTSLHSKLWDITFDYKNRQRKSAARILKGAHKYNREQVKSKVPFKQNQLWLVQNIAVNQHTNNGGYTSYDSATVEATLMSEIAMLFTLTELNAHFPKNINTKILSVYNSALLNYKKFLNTNEQGDLYFKDSSEGINCIEQLKTFKEEIKKISTASQNTDSLTKLAANSVLLMFAYNWHWDKQYGMLIQSLSIFLEKISMAGCKSANERYLAVCGRVELLHGLESKPVITLPNESAAATDSDKEKEKLQKLVMEHTEKLKNALQTFITQPQNKANINALQITLDTAYNALNMYNSSMFISEADQGAGPKGKVSQSKDGLIKEIDTNYYETNPASFFQQKNAGNIQVHKLDHEEIIEQAAQEELGVETIQIYQERPNRSLIQG